MAVSFRLSSFARRGSEWQCGSREREMKKVKNGKEGLREEKERRKSGEARRGAAQLYTGFFKKEIIKVD